MRCGSCEGGIVSGLMSSQSKKLTTKNKGAIKLYEQAMFDFGKGNIGSATANLNSAIARDPKFIEAHLLLGDIYNNRNEHLKEMEILQKALAIDSTFYPATYVNIGNAAYNAGLYSEAIEWYELFQRKYTEKRSAEGVKVRLEKVRFAIQMLGNTHDIELFSVGEGINSVFDEYCPA